MRAASVILSALLLHAVAAAPAVTTTTSTKVTTGTTCSCKTTSKNGGKTSTLTYTNSATCSSKKIKPTCKATVGTTKVTLTITPTSTSTSKTSTSSSKTSSTSTSASGTPTPNYGPRGLAYNEPTLTQPFSLSGQNSKVSWSYNWYSVPYTPSYGSQSGYNPVLEFVPMLWSNASDLTSIWTANVAKGRAQYGTKAVLAFNEPDLCGGGSSCMSPAAAAEAYRKWVQPLAGTVRLGAPAVSNSGNANQGLDWLRQFLLLCANCTFDFVPVHWYGDAGDVTGFQSLVQQAYQTAGGRKLWITEFGTTSGTASSFLQSAMSWLDGSGKSMVERYSWFMDAPGNLISSSSVGLSPLGTLYNSG